MSRAKLPNPKLLPLLLRYEADTGRLFWKERTSAEHPNSHGRRTFNAQHAGAEALTAIAPPGYRSGSIFNTPIHAHRVIWALLNGEWPAGQIDHINGNKLDNRAANLRHVVNIDNAHNQRLKKSNKSGVHGVWWSAQRNKWSAKIKVNYQSIHLGYFANKDDAIAARKAAEIKFNFHPNHGKAAA